MEGTVLDFEKWVISGIEVNTPPLKPIITTKKRPITMEKREEDDQEEFPTTPTSPESRIPTTLTCPPAPKRRKSAASASKSHYGKVKEFFFNLSDLEKYFRRVEGA